MITHIDLLRHGETEYHQRYCGSTDHPLSPQGWAQMWREAAQAGSSWQRIVASPLIRCAAFAQALGQLHSIPVTYDARLREIHFGAWENQSAADLMHTQAEALACFWRNPVRFPPPQGERLFDFQSRVLATWNEIVTQFAGQSILLITHGGVIRVIRCHVQQHPLERLLELEVKHAEMHRISIASTALTTDSPAL